MNFPIPIVDDNITESMERFNLALSSLDDVVLGPDSILEILDNDGEFVAFSRPCYQFHHLHEQL